MELLLQLGRVEEASQRLQKMRQIPSWRSDARFQLCEVSVSLGSVNNSEEFGPTEALYSLQEMIQMHGPSPRLTANLLAVLGVLGKFGEAQAVVSRQPQLGCDGEANAVAIHSHLQAETDSIKYNSRIERFLLFILDNLLVNIQIIN